jgi:hypothetical protein
MKISRRGLLWSAVGIAAVAGLGVIGFGPMAARAQIASHIRRRLHFLRLDEEGLQTFARDQVDAILKKRPSWNRMKYHFMSVLPKPMSKYNRSNDNRSRRERIEDTFATTYLLSSDFFINGANVSQTVHYIGYYDPMRPCGNPFARPAVDSRAPT